MKVLVTGATGYIGGRLVPRLLDVGHDVRVLVRDFDSVRGREWEQRVEVRRGDLLEPASLQGVLDDVDAAYYLVHSMYAGQDFAAQDRKAAEHFCTACHASAQGGPAHVVYLGGLQPEGTVRSEHLRSRAEVGEVLAERLPGKVTEFRAGPIIGSGSASFEMVRYLTERLPVMVTPRWVNTSVTPIAVRDVLAYLEAALRIGPAGVVDVGGEMLSFKAMMHGFAAERGLRRWIIPTPVLAPKLAARWVGLVTPIPNSLAVPLVAGVTQPLVADTAEASARFPDVVPLDYRAAVRYALGKIDEGQVETRWSGAPQSAGVLASTRDGSSAEVSSQIDEREGLCRDRRELVTDVPAARVFEAVCRLGGPHGYHGWGWAWAVRGLFDRLIGGPGLRRGRRDPDRILEGEALDFWRVERVDAPGERMDAGESGEVPEPQDPAVGVLRLRAEMKLPGRAWLQWEVEPTRDGARLRQTAVFEPFGLPGALYWYALLPAHGFIFPGMLRGIEQTAKTLWQQQTEPTAVFRASNHQTDASS